MNINQFKQQVKPLRERVYELLNRKGESPLPQQDLLTESFEELYIALEELEVAEQELCQQSEELHQQNLELAIERQRYQDLFEFAPDGYLLTDANGTIREANRAAATLLNVRQRFLVGKPLYIFFTKEVRHDFLSKLNQLRQIDRLQEWEVSLSPRKGDPIDAAVSVAVVRNWEGEPVTLCWLLRDITSRKRVSEALLRAKVAEAARVELEKEISERKRLESQLLNNAFHDALTGLPNRALFIKRLERAIEYGLQHKDYLFAVLFLDLDGFKVINDSLGHIFGDQLLIAIASRLATCLRPTDIAARLGGDELTVLLEGINDISDAIKVAERIQAELKLPFILGDQEVFTTASIGIALSATGYYRPSDYLRDADIAMYRAKSQGKARYEIFNKDMHIQAVARLQLETDLRRAVAKLPSERGRDFSTPELFQSLIGICTEQPPPYRYNNAFASEKYISRNMKTAISDDSTLSLEDSVQEFLIHYQPIVALDTGLITGFEALVRLWHPVRGLVPPTDFFPVAVETGLSIPINRWVFTQACRQAKQWQEQYPDCPPLKISVNLCSRQFAQPDLIKHIDQILQESNLDAHSLQLEITESIIMENSESATLRLSQLRDLGIQLSIDDFGTGYSSLGRLHSFPISILKIDRSFVSRIGTNAGNLEIIETIVTLARKLGVDVTAEGVETPQQLAHLRELKCEYGQGYFFSQPLDSQAAEALILASPQW